MLHAKLLEHQAALRAGAALNVPLFRTKNAKSIDQVLDEHIATVTKALEKVKEGEKSTEEKLTELRGEITELSQRMAQGGRSGGSEHSGVTLGGMFVREKGEELRAMANEGGRRVGLSVKAVTSGAASGGALNDPMRDDVVTMPRRPLMVRDLLPVIRTESGSVEYVKQTTRTLNAAPVAEGALKPESDVAYSLVTLPMRTIAHWVQASRQILEDAPQLAGLIETDLLYGLADVEDRQLLLGDGTGQNLAGLYTNATDYAAPYALPTTPTAPNKMDRIGSALLQLALNDFNGDGIVMHTADWLRIKLLKDAAGGYVSSDPISGKMGYAPASDKPMLWGVPVIPTKAMPVGKYLVGEFRAAATLYDRWVARVEASTEDRDNFVRNLCTILAEERLGQAIKQAGALIRGDFSADA